MATSNRGIALSLLLLAAAGSAEAGEGFGMIKKSAVLSRIHPPDVHIGGTRIAVRAQSQVKGSEAAAERLQSQLESELLSGDPRLSPDPANPQTVVEVAVIENQSSERRESRRESKSEDTGQKDAKGKKVYRSVEVTVQYVVVNARFAIAYKVVDHRTGANLNADSILWTFNEDFREGQGAPPVSELQGRGIASVVADLVRRLTPTPEKMGVLIPRGSFDTLVNLAEAGLWNKYQEALEERPPRPRREDEAYRQYGLGLAYEALGYAAETPEETLRYLEQAASHYNAALEANPAEKYFSQPYDPKWANLIPGVRRQAVPAPHARVRQAMVQYQKLKEALLADARLAAGAKEVTAKAAPAEAGFGNAAVIEMVKAGLSESVILTSIADAGQTAFDVSPQGLIELSKASVPVKIIQKIQAVAGGRATPASKTRKGKPSQ